MAAPIPYMPLHIGEYLADAAHLSTIEHGAYLLLIMNYWQRGEALPADDRKLARIARMSDGEWADARETLSEFFATDDGVWRHGRIDRELDAARGKIEQKRNAGKASANSRSTDAQQALNNKKKIRLEEEKKEPEANASAGVDPMEAVWAAGKTMLSRSGVRNPGAMLGKWRRDHGAEALAVALGRAQREGAIDPVAFVQGCFRAASRHEAHQPELAVPC